MTIRLSCLSDIIPALVAEAKGNPNVAELMRAISSVVDTDTADYSYVVETEFVSQNKTEVMKLEVGLKKEVLEEFALTNLSGAIKLEVRTALNYWSARKYTLILTMTHYSTKRITIRSRELRKFLDWFVLQVEEYTNNSIRSFEEWVESHPYSEKKFSRDWLIFLACLSFPITLWVVTSFISGIFALFVWCAIMSYPFKVMSEYFS